MSSSKLLTEKPDNTVILARIGRPKGLKGEVFLHVETDRPEEVLGPGTHLLQDGRSVEVVKLAEHSGKWLWTLQGATRDDVARYTNARVVAKVSELPPRDEGDYSEGDIIGLSVEDTLGRKRGTIVRIERRYEIDTWIVRDETGAEGELTALESFIKEVDISAGVVTVTPDSIFKG